MLGLMHDVFDLDRALGAQDLVEVDGAEQLEGRIDDENLAEAVRQVLVLAHVVDGLADRPERRHRHELGLHAPAGGLFRIVERATQPDALGERQLRQDLVLVLLVEVFQDVDGVVGIELLDGLGDLLVGQIVDDVEADRLVDLGQRGEVEILAEQFDQRAALLGHQRFEQVAQLRLVQAPDVLLQRQRVAIGDRRADMRQERWKDDAVFAIDVGGRHIGGVTGLWRVLPDLPPRPLASREFVRSGLAPKASEFQTKCTANDARNGAAKRGQNPGGRPVRLEEEQ